MNHDRNLRQGHTLSERLASLIHEMCAASAVTHDLSTLGNLILDLAVGHTSARRGSLMLLDESNRLSILASRGLDHEVHDGPPVRLGEGVAGIVAQRMFPILVKDISTEMLFRGSQRDCYKTNSFISCPVASRQRLVGVLNVSDRDNGEPFGEDDLELLKIICDHAAVLIENCLLTDQMQAKTEKLQLLSRKLAGIEAGKSEFLARVSHELRTPLNSMKGAIHYLQLSGNVPPKKQQLFLSIISQETMKLIETVEGLLPFLMSGNDGEAAPLSASGFGDRELDDLTASALGRAVELSAEILGVESCAVMLSDDAGNLVLRSAVGFEKDVAATEGLPVAESVAARVAREGKPLLIPGVDHKGRFNKAGLPGYNRESLISVPLRIKAQTFGVMNVKTRKDAHPLTESDLGLASLLAERIANLLSNVLSGGYGILLLKKLIISLDRLLQACRTSGRKESLLREILPPLLERLRLPDEEKATAHYAAALYDLGLADMRNSLRGRKDLMPSERHILRLHPYSTLSLLDKFEFSEALKSVILHHHEHWDGTGYPHGLRGAEIPFLSRVIAVADSFCAMLTEKPHKAALSLTEALGEMRRGSGSRYDPAVIEALCAVVPRWLEGHGRHPAPVALP